MVSMYRVGIMIEIISAFKPVFILCRIFGLKLWYPQILQSINDNEKVNGAGIGFCNIVESISNINISSTDSECTVVSNSARHK